MTACARPGCSGTIQDGYCDVCGMAAAPAKPTPSVEDPRRIGGGSSTPAAAAEPTVTGTSRSVTGRSASGRTRGSTSRGRLGAGLVTIPPVPTRDPTSAVLSSPSVPERKRFCGACGAPVGRTLEGRPSRAKGYCAQCGAPFSFLPSLVEGDVVGGQYEVLGCIAYGGLGWIYLARDRNVDGRWVVLKGLIDTGDADALAAAVAERRFLAEVKHPSIVKIYNFVQHRDPHTGTDMGYIVMEYLGGQSLKELYKASSPLPLEQVLAYALEVLPALGYLHDLGLLYCDFKPDNVIQSGDELQLIDLGGVRRMDDDESAIWGTVGYQDPDLAARGPSIATDLYTVARTMAVLSFAFSGFSGERAGSLPDPLEVELLATHESYYRLLKRATNPDADARFESAAAMAEQVRGVLREVLAAQDGVPRPALSTLFGPELRAVGADGGFPAEPIPVGQAALALPIPIVDPADPHAGVLATVTAAGPEQLLRTLSEVPSPSVESSLWTARARIQLGEPVGAELDALESDEPDEWRVMWYRGFAGLAGGDLDAAVEAFEAVLDAFPGEAAPKLALALCAEARGDRARAAQLYEVVWRTDHTYVSSAFGLARMRFADGDRPGAAAALESVPEASSLGITARLAAVRARTHGRPAADELVKDFFEAADRVERLDLDDHRRQRVTAEVLETALAWLLAGRPGTPPSGGTTLFGNQVTERGLRLGLERAYRALARMASTVPDRVTLVDRANAVRPRTWT